MPGIDLSEAERQELLRLLRTAIINDPYPLSPRIKRLKSIRDKLEPPPPSPEPYPPVKPPGEPSVALRRRRRR